jgi:crotonobetainyl-CoA:carnitine CoA-transferase CaiB-like acyl-CoA transferase
MAHAIGADALVDDPRFASNKGRMENREALVEEMTPIFRTRSTDEWLTILEDAGIPAGPVLSITEMHGDPQTLARDMVVTLDHPVAGATKAIGLPVKFSDTPGSVRRPAPLLGEHTREILAELGYRDTDRERHATS